MIRSEPYPIYPTMKYNGHIIAVFFSPKRHVIKL